MALRDKILKDKQRVNLKELYEDEVRLYKEKVKKEEDRVVAMTCPCCKSADKKHNMLSTSNGVMGPGYSSRIIADYYICQSCGIHYSDMNKIELVYPEKPLFPRK